MAKKTNYKKKCDEEWKRIIRSIGYCEMCGRKGIRGRTKGWTNLHAHHIIGRASSCYRHDLSNGLCLCARCHKWTPISPHVDKNAFLRWLEKNRRGQYLWYMNNTIEVKKEICGEVVITRKPKQPSCKMNYKRIYELLKRVD